jgi:hypothetical protein
MGSVRVELYTDDSRVLTHPTVRLDLALDARIDETVAFEVGSLTIELPASVTLPSAGRLSVKLRSSADVEHMQSFGAAVGEEPSKRTWTFDKVLTGEFTLEVELSDARAKLEEVPHADGSVSFRAKPIYAAELSVVVRADETTRVAAP